MSDNIKNLFMDKGIRYAVFVSIAILVIELIVITIFFPKFPPLIPLFNSLSWGKDRLAFSQFIFTIPLFLFIICVANITFASFSYRRHVLLSRMVTINLLLTVSLSLIALGQILLLIF